MAAYLILYTNIFPSEIYWGVLSSFSNIVLFEIYFCLFILLAFIYCFAICLGSVIFYLIFYMFSF